MNLVKKRGEIPSYHELEVDPVLDEDFRRILATNEYAKPLSIEKTKRSLDTLEKYRKIRDIYAMCTEGLKALKDSSVDVEDLLTKSADKLAIARTALSEGEELTHFGRGNNSTDVVKKILYGKIKTVIPTGFKTFDERNGGFFRTGVAILSANSGGGKSIMALQLAINMYYAGYSTMVLTLEMDKEQYTARFLSNISGVNSTKIFLKKTNDEEKSRIKKAYKKFVLFGKKNKVRWSILAPKNDLPLDKVLLVAKPYGFHVITIDYLSLLPDASVDNQARALAEITRKLKVFVQNTHSLVIALAQLNEEGFIKYARAIKENADHVWTWVYSEAQRESHTITIKVDKGRNQLCFPFDVQEDYSTMKVTDQGPTKDFDEDAISSDSSDDDEESASPFMEEEE
jgi:archaellum biogenesis ATPase FlaH